MKASSEIFIRSRLSGCPQPIEGSSRSQSSVRQRWSVSGAWRTNASPDQAQDRTLGRQPFRIPDVSALRTRPIGEPRGRHPPRPGSYALESRCSVGQSHLGAPVRRGGVSYTDPRRLSSDHNGATEAVLASRYRGQSQPKNTSASANSSGDTSLRTAVASANGTSSMAVPCRATICPECPSCKASTA